MVVFSLYRMEKGWGKGRSHKALSVWSGTPGNKDGGCGGGDNDAFPLENLWKEEIRQRIDEKELGKNTLGHIDNFYYFPHFYGDRNGGTTEGRWARRSNSYIGQVHIFAEQAAVQLAVQLAVHLHRNVSKSYSFLAAFGILHGLKCGDDDEM
mmetsp:Transcript_32507/g.59627  ORF Transcript_32507/g.59627 Transcript_32507/m.59627 type:complete len:152 (+) Transcript_32507:411-866(+)